MNWIDFVIISLLGFGLIKGFMDGLIIEVAELAALILGIWGAIHFSGWTAAKLSGWFDMQTSWLGIIAFGITFIVIVVAINLLGKVIDTFMKAIALGFVVRMLGAIFGIIKSALILSVVFVFLNTLHQKRAFLPSDRISKSYLYNPIADIVPSIFPIVEGGDLLDSFNRHKKKPQDVAL
ncbi:MAG: CvpA family protein [Bacteroidia bacterium]|jgi:membrane protein required for colicin V production|nr:MAG: CvpA family protein [Bacteroidia bacterium]